MLTKGVLVAGAAAALAVGAAVRHTLAKAALSAFGQWPKLWVAGVALVVMVVFARAMRRQARRRQRLARRQERRYRRAGWSQR